MQKWINITCQPYRPLDNKVTIAFYETEELTEMNVNLEIKENGLHSPRE